MSEREARYAEALDATYPFVTNISQDRVARVMAVADAEQAEARAEVERLRALLSTMDHFAEVAETCERKSNKYAAENAALRAQVEAMRGLADEWIALGRGDVAYWWVSLGETINARLAIGASSSEPVTADPEDDQRKPGEAFCGDCPDHEACATAWPCWKVKEVARDAAKAKRPTFESMLADPREQFDRKGEALAVWLNADGTTIPVKDIPSNTAAGEVTPPAEQRKPCDFHEHFMVDAECTCPPGVIPGTNVRPAPTTEGDAP